MKDVIYFILRVKIYKLYIYMNVVFNMHGFLVSVVCDTSGPAYLDQHCRWRGAHVPPECQGRKTSALGADQHQLSRQANVSGRPHIH